MNIDLNSYEEKIDRNKKKVGGKAVEDKRR